MGLKLKFGKGGLKGFLAQHVEKGIFGMVLVLVAAFIYSSATQETVEQGESPNSLKGGAAGALNTLQSGNPWAALAPERLAKIDDYPKLAQNARQPVDDAAYRGTIPWIKELVPRQQKRQDPEIYAPVQPEAEAGVFAMVTRLTRPDDAWLGDKDAVEAPPEKPKPKPRRDRRSRNNPYGDMYGDMYGGSGEGSMGMPPGYAEGSMGMPSGYSEEMGMPSPEYGSEMGGYGTGVMGGRRTLGQFYIKHYLSKGYRPTIGMGTPGIAARSFPVVAVKALVPFEKQWEEYERALANATGYSPMHDIPKYLLFVAERAEVTDDPDAPLKWQTVSNSSFAMEWARKNYAGVPPEMADEAYLLPGTLTMPVPPVLLQPYDELALHSEIPRKKLAMPYAMGQQPGTEEGEEGTEQEQAAAEPQPSDDFSEGLPRIPLAGTPGMGGMGSYGTMPGMGYPGSEMTYGGEGGMYGSTPGMEYGSSGAYPGATGSMPGEYGMSGGYGMPGVQQPLVKYKMVRFFDFTAQPGKSYQYRVRVMMEDPNRPLDKNAEPNPRILDQAVADRLAKIIADDEEYIKTNGKFRRTAWRQTDWSEPSNVVTVESPERFVGGGATSARSVKLSLTGPSVELEEAKGKVVTVVWDQRRATEMPAEREVLRGEFFNFTHTADVLQPLTLQIKRIEDYNFDTDAFVADLRGGEPLLVDVDKTSKEETPLPVPGEYLIVDGDGSLIVCNEVDDAEDYRRLLFIEDRPQMGGTAAPASGYEDMMSYPSSYPSYGP